MEIYIELLYTYNLHTELLYTEDWGWRVCAPRGGVMRAVEKLGLRHVAKAFPEGLEPLRVANPQPLNLRVKSWRDSIPSGYHRATLHKVALRRKFGVEGMRTPGWSSACHTETWGPASRESVSGGSRASLGSALPRAVFRVGISSTVFGSEPRAARPSCPYLRVRTPLP